MMKRLETMVSFKLTGIHLFQLPQIKWWGEQSLLEQAMAQHCCCWRSNLRITSLVIWADFPTTLAWPSCLNSIWFAEDLKMVQRRATKVEKWRKGHKERWETNGAEKTLRPKMWQLGGHFYDAPRVRVQRILKNTTAVWKHEGQCISTFIPLLTTTTMVQHMLFLGKLTPSFRLPLASGSHPPTFCLHKAHCSGYHIMWNHTEFKLWPLVCFP